MLLLNSFLIASAKCFKFSIKPHISWPYLTTYYRHLVHWERYRISQKV